RPEALFSQMALGFTCPSLRTGEGANLPHVRLAHSYVSLLGPSRTLTRIGKRLLTAIAARTRGRALSRACNAALFYCSGRCCGRHVAASAFLSPTIRDGF